MPSYCRVSILGHLGGDAEIKYFQNGTAYANLNIAVNRPRPAGDSGERKTDWYRVTIMGKAAERCDLKKGELVEIRDAQMVGREWTDREGHERSAYDIKAYDFILMSKREGVKEQDVRNAFPGSKSNDDPPF